MHHHHHDDADALGVIDPVDPARAISAFCVIAGPLTGSHLSHIIGRAIAFAFTGLAKGGQWRVEGAGLDH